MHRMIPQSLPDFTKSLFWKRKYFQKVLYRVKSYGRLRQYFWWDRKAQRLNYHLQSFINRFESQLFIILRRMRLAPSYAVAYFLIRKGFVTVDDVPIYDVKFRLFRGARIQVRMQRLSQFLAHHYNESFGDKERIEEEELGNRPHFGNRLGLYYENLTLLVKRYQYQHLHVDYRGVCGIYLHDATLAFAKYARLQRTFKEYRRLFSIIYANGKFTL
jgi:ribosomal protein S4